MNRIDYLNRINVLLSRFETEVSGLSSMGFTDIHKGSEDVLLPIFRIVYNLPNLRNLNTDKPNHPAIDLGDKTSSLAFQITGTSSLEKIESTFKTFFAHKLHETYSEIIFFFLTPKKSSYPKKKLATIIDERIHFNQNDHIRDFNDLKTHISGLETEKLKKIKDQLEIEIGESKKRYSIDYEKLPRHELLFPNLLRIDLPEDLYVAELNYKRNEVIKSSWETEHRIKMKASDRQVAKSALIQNGVSYPQDWVIHNKQIVTFHDIEDNENPLSTISESVTKIKPEEFYKVNKDLENVFKGLLWRCLQQMLYKNGVTYQNQVGLFIFVPVNEEEERRISWMYKKRNERTVFKKVMRKKNPELLDAYTHFAFDSFFELINDQWFIAIQPDWFFSYDKYKKSRNSADKVKYKKKNESNKAVYDHFNFLSYFLRNIHESQGNLFDQNVETLDKYYLKFTKVTYLDNAPNIDDKKWLIKEPIERKNVFENDQVEIQL